MEVIWMLVLPQLVLPVLLVLVLVGLERARDPPLLHGAPQQCALVCRKCMTKYTHE